MIFRTISLSWVMLSPKLMDVMSQVGWKYISTKPVRYVTNFVRLRLRSLRYWAELHWLHTHGLITLIAPPFSLWEKWNLVFHQNFDRIKILAHTVWLLMIICHLGLSVHSSVIKLTKEWAVNRSLSLTLHLTRNSPLLNDLVPSNESV